MALEADGRQLIFMSFSIWICFLLQFCQHVSPFFILNISPYSSAQTLLWIGAVLGSTGIVTALTSNFWETFTPHFRLKSLYFKGILLPPLLFFLIGLTADFHFQVLLRMLTGMIGVIIDSSSSLKKGSPHLVKFINP